MVQRNLLVLSSNSLLWRPELYILNELLCLPPVKIYAHRSLFSHVFRNVSEHCLLFFKCTTFSDFFPPGITFLFPAIYLWRLLRFSLSWMFFTSWSIQYISLIIASDEYQTRELQMDFACMPKLKWLQVRGNKIKSLEIISRVRNVQYYF